MNLFVAPVSYGLISAGQARTNQSIEAFVYCIPGSQVKVLEVLVLLKKLVLIEMQYNKQTLVSLFKYFSLLFKKQK